MLPDYGTVSMKGTQYYRTRVTDQNDNADWLYIESEELHHQSDLQRRDPKTVQHLAGHENSKTTMDIYAKVKYNKTEELSSVVNAAFGLR